MPNMEQGEPRPTPDDLTGDKLPFPANQSDMNPQPDSDLSQYRPAQKLVGKVALITGADSGIGRAVAVAFAKEGANVAIVYLAEDSDAEETRRMVAEAGQTCLIIKADVRDKAACLDAVKQTVDRFGGLNILVNNAAYQMAQKDFLDITEEQLRRTFDTNILGYMFMAQAALPHLKKFDTIINTGSVVGFTGLEILIDYASTKAAIHTFTKSLALSLGEKGIRVNCVAPGPVWTPAIPATMPSEEVAQFGHEVALGRAGQPEELAPAYAFLASWADSSFVTGASLEFTGGRLSSQS